MYFDINATINGLDGKPLVGLFGPQDKDAITFARLFILVCANGDQADTPEKKYMSFKTGIKVVAAADGTAGTGTGGLVDLTAEEQTRLKELVGKNYTPTVYGRTVDFLASPVGLIAAAPPSPADPAALLTHLEA